MKIFTTLLFSLFIVGNISAQFHYSYISDKRFQSPEELLGYELKPNTIVFPNPDNPKRNQEVPLNPGDITFRATRNYLIVDGDAYPDYKGAYSVNSINPERYGYKLDLMNARNPSIQGHLKIILNNKSEIDAYIFQPSPKEKEVVFYQAKIPSKINKQEETYFTDWGEVIINDTSLWGTTVYPFFELEKTQRRLLPEDSLNITFQVDTVIVNKKKNKKKAIYTVIVRYNEKNQDGDFELKTAEFPIDKIVERESRNPQDKDIRFRIEFSVKKLQSGKVLIYLDENRSVHSVWIGQTNYTMRGIK